MSNLNSTYDEELSLIEDIIQEEEIKWNNYKENTRYLWEDLPIGDTTLTKEELDKKYADYKRQYQ